MYIKKRILLASLLLVISLTGCGSKTGGADENLIDITTPEVNASEDVVLQTEYKVYSADVDTITYTITNQTSLDLCYGLEYELQVNKDGTWKRIPMKDGYGWNDIACVLGGNKTGSSIIYLNGYNYVFKEGTYRIVKTIGEQTYAAEFRIGQSNISKNQPYGYQSMESLPKEYTKEDMLIGGDLYVGVNEIKNETKLVEFIHKNQSGISTMIRIDQITEEGDPIITDIIYEKGRFLCKIDNSRDRFGGEVAINNQYYSYLTTDGTNLYLSNYVSYEEGKTNDVKENSDLWRFPWSSDSLDKKMRL